MTTPSDIFIKNCQERGVHINIIIWFSYNPQSNWEVCDDSRTMVQLLCDYYVLCQDVENNKKILKCLIEIVKPCLDKLAVGEAPLSILLDNLEKVTDGIATSEEVEILEKECVNLRSDAARAVWATYLASKKYSTAFFEAVNYAAISQGFVSAEMEYRKNSCTIIRKHFPIIPGLENLKTQENSISISRDVKITFTIRDQSFILTEAEKAALKHLIKDLD